MFQVKKKQITFLIQTKQLEIQYFNAGANGQHNEWGNVEAGGSERVCGEKEGGNDGEHRGSEEGKATETGSTSQFDIWYYLVWCFCSWNPC